MAECCSPVTFVGLFRNSLYFRGTTPEDAETGYCTDAFRYSKMDTSHLCHISENKFLTLNSAGQFEFKSLSMEDLDLPESNITIRIYNDSSKEKKTGTPVMLYTNSNGKKMVVCCQDNQVRPEEMDLQDSISGNQHPALFYLIKLKERSHSYMFESTLHQNSFLALKHEDDAFKLVLCTKMDEVDEGIEFRLESPSDSG
ncbi:interleukin-18-like isoform X2 [Salarias fasciatus]|uniref:interleukin-18-like isoform X2 n=1 Tax=Salarias fasciatus TaxID=181472 RepID=UPI001176EDAF|nr:interleukin-18-like isoform X2 [Salarias fasciatus]